MPETATIDSRSQDYAFALGGECPELTADDLHVFDEPDADLARVEWEGWIALFSQSDAAHVQLDAMLAIMPHLRGFISPAVPIWERHSDSSLSPQRWLAAPRPQGRPLRPELIVDQNRERLVRALASFLHELHEFSVERARSLGAASFREWRDAHDALASRSLSILRPLLSWSDITWARRWWSRFLDDDEVWRIQPSLVHGGISVERLQVDHFAQELAAVSGWHGLRIGDPALDIAYLVDAYGTELTWRVVERYGELGSLADAALFRRVRLQQTVRRFRDLAALADREGADSEAVAEAAKLLR